MKKIFDLVDYVHQMGRNNIFVYPVLQRGTFWSLVFGGTHLVYLLQVKYFVIRKGRKKGVNHW